METKLIPENERPRIDVAMFKGERYGKYTVVRHSPAYKQEVEVEWYLPFGKARGWIPKSVLLKL